MRWHRSLCNRWLFVGVASVRFQESISGGPGVVVGAQSERRTELRLERSKDT